MKATRTEPIYTLEMTESEAILLLALLGDMTWKNWKDHLSNYEDMFDHITSKDTDKFYDAIVSTGLVVPDI